MPSRSQACLTNYEKTKDMTRGSAAVAAAKSCQSCSTLCNPIDRSLPGSSIHGIFQQEYWSGSPVPSLRGSAGFSLSPGFCLSLLNYVHSVPNLQLPLPTKGSPSL